MPYSMQAATRCRIWSVWQSAVLRGKQRPGGRTATYGKLVGTGGDWMLAGPDGFLRMDVRIQTETHDGALICANYFGPAEANAKLKQAVMACAATEFADHSIRSHWMLETGDPRYLWVNQTVFAGRSRLLPAGNGLLGFEHEVYRLA